MSGGDTFHPRELFQALARHGVEYVTVGGVAIQAHGAQRLTRDLDVAIAASKDNVDRVAAALSDVDARILGPDGQRSRSTPSAAVLASGDQWHLVTSYGRLDVLTLPAHLGSFADMRARAHDVPLGDVKVPIAHRDDLLRMKRASGRPQDLEDVRLSNRSATSLERATARLLRSSRGRARRRPGSCEQGASRTSPRRASAGRCGFSRVLLG